MEAIMDQSKSVRSSALILILALFVASPDLAAQSAPATGPLRRNPANPRYFTDGSGRAIYLTGSHHWNNLQDRSGRPIFDYAAYLNFMQQHNHNFMRMWAWEESSSPPLYLRTGPGTAGDGGLKYDTNQLNQAYFDRLRSRVIAARDRGIYVSIMLFQGWSIEQKEPTYNKWPVHWFNAANNINGINGDPDNDGNGHEVHTLAIPAITTRQDAYVRKVVDTVNDLDNVLYEITNESHTQSVQWQYHIINLIHQYQAGKPQQHPVGMTSLGYAAAKFNSIPTNPPLFNSPADWISPFGGGDLDGYMNNPPASTGAKVILTDTDHIWGNGGTRVWVWKSFCRGLNPIFMDVTPPLGDWTLSTANEVRQAMGHTLTYARKMNLTAMTPQNGLASTGYCLAQAGSEYLVYQPGSGAFTVNLAAGTYAAEWFNPATGAASPGATVSGGAVVSFTPPFGGTAVLYLKSGTSSPGELVGHWKLDEGSGTAAADSSGKGNTGTLLSGAAWTSGKSGAAAAFDGVDDHLRVPASASINSTTTRLTVAAWIFRNSSQAGWRILMARQRGTSWEDQYILGFYENAYRFGVNTTGTSGGAAGGVAPTGQWIHVAGTYDGSAVRLYVNGAQVASAPASGSLLIDSARPLLIGAGQNDATSAVQEAFSGRIDDARLYSRALSASEVQALAGSGGSSGNGTGLRGEYFDNIDFTSLKVARTDPTVNFDWGTGAPDPSMGPDTFSVRWTGEVEAPASGTYTFTTASDDGVRLWINGQLLVNNWTDHGATENSGSISLTAGQRAAVRMEYYEQGGDTVAQLFWTGPGIARQIVPQGRLYPASGGTGLTAQYFDNIDFTALTVTRRDSTVNFDWGLNGPAAGVAVDTFSIRWTGFVEAPATGLYTFTTASDDGVRLWVNGQLMVDNWTDHAVIENSGTISLTAGQKVAVKMEFYERGGYAVAKLLWAGPGIAKQVIPTARLFP
jgi:hypothetical protein